MERDIPWMWIILAMLSIVALAAIEMRLRKEAFFQKRRARRRGRGFRSMKSHAQRGRERSGRGPEEEGARQPKPGAFNDRVYDDAFRAGKVSRRPRSPRRG